MSKKKTHEEFMGELYIKNLHFRSSEFTVTGQYVNSQTPVECACQKHGVWDANPTVLLHGSGCPKCAGRNRTHSDFLADLSLRSDKYRQGLYVVLDDYQNATEQIRCECSVCGYQWKSTPHGLLSGKGCPACAGVLKKNHSTFLGELQNKNEKYSKGLFVLTSEYKNAKTPVSCRCVKCGKEWETSPRALLMGCGCPHCSAIGEAGDEFLNRLEQSNSHYANGDFILLGEYSGTQGMIECECNTCHEIWTTAARNLLAGHACPYCGGSHKMSHAQFIEELTKNNEYYASGKLVLTTQYQGMSKPIQCKCSQCGRVWEAEARSLYRGSGCETCGFVRVGGSRAKPYDDFRRGLLANNRHYSSGDFEITGTYRGFSNPIACKCNVCGNEWAPIAANLAKIGSGCPRCAGRVSTQSDFISKLKQKNRMFEEGQFELRSQYKSAKGKLTCYCTACNAEWTTSANSLLAGTGCPNCAKQRIGKTKALSQDDFLERFNSINPYASSIEVVGAYEGRQQSIECHCKRCGLIWRLQAGSLLAGRGCPRCCKSGTSFMEQFIYKAFAMVLGDSEVESRNRTAIGKELDIYIPSLKVGIEPGSWVWHYDKVDEDAQKRCAGVRVITIYDHMDESVDNPFEDDFYRFSFDLGSEDGHPTLKRLVCQLYCDLGLDVKFGDDEWDAIERYAYEHSMSRSHQDFVLELEGANVAFRSKDFELLSEYQGALNHIDCLCAKCGRTWTTTPSKLLANRSCPFCSGAARKTHEEFISELRARNRSFASGEFLLVGSYKAAHKPIECRCTVCGNVWSPVAARILSGAGCPRCNGGVRLSHDDFLCRLKLKNSKFADGKFEVCGTYSKSNEPIACKCKVCGNEWNPAPSSLLSGAGCPVCAGKRGMPKRRTRRDGNQSFIQNLMSRNPEFSLGHFELRSECTSVNDKVSCHCNVCGRDWETRARTLLSGSACPSCRGGEGKRVRCIETADEYPSLAKAAAAVGRSYIAVREAIKRGGVCGGFHWEFVNNG